MRLRLLHNISTAATYSPSTTHAAVVPARAGRPRDKANADTHVLIAQRWILAALRPRRCFRLAELTAAIRELLVALNDRPMKKLGVSRRALFEQLDRPALRPLPPTRYEFAEWRDATANIDSHVAVEHNYYSVPSQLVHQRVGIRLSAAPVESFFTGRRWALHRRLWGRGHHALDPAHMPHAHRAHAEWTPSRLIAWAETTGAATAQVVAALLASNPHPEQGYRACLGILCLSKAYGSERTDAACARALHLGAPSYRPVQNILASGVDRVPSAVNTAGPPPPGSRSGIAPAAWPGASS